MRYAVILAVMLGMLAVMLGMFAGTAVRAAEQAVELPFMVQSLQGHEIVAVAKVIIAPAKCGERIGLKEETITSFVLDRLYKSRILAVPRTAQSVLSLELTVDLMEMTEAGSYVFCVGGMSHQVATLRDSKAILPVITWADLHLGWSKASNGVIVREAVDKLLDRFIEDWRTAHKSISKPKPGASSSPDAGDDFLQDIPIYRDLVNALSLEEFLKKYPRAIEAHDISMPNIGLRDYKSFGARKYKNGIGSFTYEFLDEKLISVIIISPASQADVTRDFAEYQAAFGVPDTVDIPSTTQEMKVGATRFAEWCHGDLTYSLLAYLAGDIPALETRWSSKTGDIEAGGRIIREILGGSPPDPPK